ADLSLGAFSSEPPWLIEPESLVWRRKVDDRRQATQAQVPRLLRRRRLPPGGRVVTVAAELGRALAGWYLIDRRAARRQDRPELSRAGLSKRLRQSFQQLGPTYIKLGQIL